MNIVSTGCHPGLDPGSSIIQAYLDTIPQLLSSLDSLFLLTLISILAAISLVTFL